jgi:hypothetical protein
LFFTPTARLRSALYLLMAGLLFLGLCHALVWYGLDFMMRIN